MKMLRGVVHDPTARRMGGVAGHAGLFSTGGRPHDLRRACCSAAARWDHTRVLAPLTVARMTIAGHTGGEPNVRGPRLGSGFVVFGQPRRAAAARLVRAHGFTGTSIWVDPATRVFIIFLSNRVHPDGRGDVTPLRARVSRPSSARRSSTCRETTRRAWRSTGSRSIRRRRRWPHRHSRGDVRH
jgi:CubicO group peptidase (beta-lactamase class C family)